MNYMANNKNDSGTEICTSENGDTGNYDGAETQVTQPALNTTTLAAVLKASADPLRLEILRVLETDSFGVLELCNLFDTKQSGMSHHLKVLNNVGLTETQREGNSIFYRRPLARVNDPQSDAIQTLLELVDQTPIETERMDRIKAIRAQRAEQSRLFFAKNAEKFREQQELIAAYEQYADPAKELLFNESLKTRDSALEIGPGKGSFLSDLSTGFNKVYALDNSSDMLNAARQHAAEHKLDNIEFIYGETDVAVAQKLTVDAIVLNMVLHHVASPRDIFRDSQALLKPGGVMILTDLCHHDQDWAKTNCGDLWLGFEPQELTQWAIQSGLEESESLYIGLRNGFQIQARKFINSN
ncbi:MAG: metalloregulator ArsR/SmtB family transcription factor [Pseudomonadales bacterium]|nr:metalloregulator ArsR/SmtB family transcription factor [Pseudomonadales bacterium]